MSRRALRFVARHRQGLVGLLAGLLLGIALVSLTSSRDSAPVHSLGAFSGSSADGRAVSGTFWREEQALGGLLRVGEREHALALRISLASEGVLSGEHGDGAIAIALSDDGRRMRLQLRGEEIEMRRRDESQVALARYETSSRELSLSLWRKGASVAGTGAWLGQTGALVGERTSGEVFTVSVLGADGVQARGRLEFAGDGARLEILGRSFVLQRRGEVAARVGGSP